MIKILLMLSSFTGMTATLHAARIDINDQFICAVLDRDGRAIYFTQEEYTYQCREVCDGRLEAGQICLFEGQVVGHNAPLIHKPTVSDEQKQANQTFNLYFLSE